MLVDASSADLIPKEKSATSRLSRHTPMKHVPFQGGFEDFLDAAPFSAATGSTRAPVLTKSSLLQNLLWYYQQRPPGLDIEDPSLLSLMYSPIRIVSSHWMLYVLLLNRYYKTYEYSLKKVRAGSALETDLIDLQRWRRRTKQSLTKIGQVMAFIHLHMPQPLPNDPSAMAPVKSELSDMCAALLGDFQHITEEIKDYRQGMDFLISISTAMSQLSMAREANHEAVNLKRLTYVALVFAPLGLVAAVFSMSTDFLPGQPRFWIFLVTAISAITIVAGLALMMGFKSSILSRTWMRSKNGIELGSSGKRA